MSSTALPADSADVPGGAKAAGAVKAAPKSPATVPSVAGSKRVVVPGMELRRQQSLRMSRGTGFRSHRPTQSEVALGLADVAADLFAEGFGGGPADLGAEALEEGEGEWGLFG